MREHRNNQRPRNIYIGKQKINIPMGKQSTSIFPDVDKKQHKTLLTSFSKAKTPVNITTEPSSTEPSSTEPSKKDE